MGEATMSTSWAKSITCCLIYSFTFTHSFQIPRFQQYSKYVSTNDRELYDKSFHTHREKGCLHLALGKEWYNRGENEEDDDEEEGDDDEELDLSDQDWRAFRAKLVMQPDLQQPQQSEQQQQQQPKQEGKTKESTLSEEDLVEDLDGIGAVFASSTSSTSSSSSAPPSTSTASTKTFTNLNLTPLDPSQWAYDSGKVIETGAIILGGVEQEFGFGLRQQYFHKTVILVLDHDENKFTKGIILNRPTDMMLVDENDEEEDTKRGWRVWFGGDVQGLDSPMPEIVCLHSLEGIPEVANVSTPVMKDIQYTTFDDAKELVNSGVAKVSDFWVFCGYAGWAPQQLMGELERKSWYMAATDSQTLLKELSRQSADLDPRDAGLETWELLMHMIGRGEMADDPCFDDYMLKEWAREKLLSDNYNNDGIEGQSEKFSNPIAAITEKIMRMKMGLSSSSSASSSAGFLNGSEKLKVGTLLRASSKERSPFLLRKQEFHKSLVLVLSDDDNLTVGVILNLPAAKGMELSTIDKATRKKSVQSLPLRYGGEYSIKGQSNSALWLHCNEALRKAKIGRPLKGVEDARSDPSFPLRNHDGIWQCTPDDAVSAIGRGVAQPHDFLVVSGVSVWLKSDGSGVGTVVGGMAELSEPQGLEVEIRKGNFEVVGHDQIQDVWDTLVKQDILTKLTLVKNLAIGKEAWEAGSAPADTSSSSTPSKEEQERVLISGLGVDEYDEEDDSFVYKTEKKVMDLCDDALRSWVATFLLGAPVLG